MFLCFCVSVFFVFFVFFVFLCVCFLFGTPSLDVIEVNDAIGVDGWKGNELFEWVVREVFIIHVGGTRCVPSSTDNTLKIHVRITLKVECIRTCIFVFLCYV